MKFGSLFSGIGGLDLGLERAGMKCRWQIEIDPFCRAVLSKHWPEVERHDDIRKVDGSKLEAVDLLCGGFPCEDISLASGAGPGILGPRSGLWREFARLLGEVRPRLALIENVPALRSRGLALVLQDLWALGFDAQWHCLPASAFGAAHERDRIFVIAYRPGEFDPSVFSREATADLDGQSLVRAAVAWAKRRAWAAQPRVVRVVHGTPHRVDRVAALGRAVVPQRRNRSADTSW